jgi:multiple sugar transport system permease protein
MTTMIEDPHPRAGAAEPPTEKLPEPASHNAKHTKDKVAAYLFLLPQLVGLLVFMIGPLVFALILSFSHWTGFGARTFAGFSNFKTVLTDHQLLLSARNTLWYTVLQVPGLMLSAFIVAYLLQKTGRTKSIYRIFYFAPVVTSSVAVAAIWLWLFNPEISPFNSLLKSVGLPAPDWLQDPKTVIPAFAIVGIWQGLGYQVVMFMAGLENVSKALMEAADIDGATEWQRMRKITIPLLSPTILFLSITSIIGSFQVFDYIYVFLETTAPESARTIVYEIVQKAFREFNFGVASAIAVCLFLALLGLTGLQLAAQKRWVHYTE